jgi:peptidoglycan L-alanyl-D-glutamate endopeptidase CwlK
MLDSRKIEDLHPYVQAKHAAHKAAAEAKGMLTATISTKRDQEYQSSLYAQGRTKPGAIVTNAALIGAHGFGLAYDMVPLTKDGKSVDWNNIKAFEAIAAEGRKLGAVCGADWKSIVDRPHYEYTEGLSYAELRAGKRPTFWAASTITKIEASSITWKEIIAKVSDSPEAWERAINAAMAAAKADGNLGDLEVMQYFPQLIEKIYKVR